MIYKADPQCAACGGFGAVLANDIEGELKRCSCVREVDAAEAVAETGEQPIEPHDESEAEALQAADEERAHRIVMNNIHECDGDGSTTDDRRHPRNCGCDEYGGCETLAVVAAQLERDAIVTWLEKYANEAGVDRLTASAAARWIARGNHHSELSELHIVRPDGFDGEALETRGEQMLKSALRDGARLVEAVGPSVLRGALEERGQRALDEIAQLDELANRMLEGMSLAELRILRTFGESHTAGQNARIDALIAKREQEGAR